MPHGGYGKRRVSLQKPSNNSHRSKPGVGGVNNKKLKATSLKNRIRSIERLLRKDIPPEVRKDQEGKLELLKKDQEEQTRLAVERKLFLRNRKIKFFERRKIERRMRRLEKHQRSLLDQAEEKKIMEELAKLKEDLEYVRFFPKAEKYVSLFCGDDNADLVDRRNRLRMQIKANLIASAASGKDLEETGSEDEGIVDTDDDFFVSGTSSDKADADDELTDISAREQASSASGKAASGMSSDERNQKQKSARSLMPPPRPQKSSKQMFDYCTSRKSSNRNMSYSGHRRFSNSQASQSSNLSSNSDAPKRRRKRRPKKKKQ